MKSKLLRASILNRRKRSGSKVHKHESRTGGIGERQRKRKERERMKYRDIKYREGKKRGEKTRESEKTR